jgi:DnaJ-class molecular chaperone
MKKRPTNSIEQDCPTCNGTGSQVVMQPEQPGHRIYPPPCKECGGKGRIPEARATKAAL